MYGWSRNHYKKWTVFSTIQESFFSLKKKQPLLWVKVWGAFFSPPWGEDNGINGWRSNVRQNQALVSDVSLTLWTRVFVRIDKFAIQKTALAGTVLLPRKTAHLLADLSKYSTVGANIYMLVLPIQTTSRAFHPLVCTIATSSLSHPTPTPQPELNKIETIFLH